jgi:predicted peroxiredoxin
LDPLFKSIGDFQRRGGTIWACPPCVQTRGYTQADLLEGVVIVGSSALHGAIKEGAATLSF